MDSRLARFCDLARAHGLVVGPTELLRLGLVLGPLPEDRWEAMAAPILVKGPDAVAAREQREALARAAREWLETRPRPARAEDRRAERDAREIAARRPASERWRPAGGWSLARGLLILALLLLSRTPAPPLVEAPTPEVQTPEKTSSDVVEAPVQPPAMVRTWVPIFEDPVIPGRDRSGPWIVLAAALLGLGPALFLPRKSPPARPLPARVPPPVRGRAAPALLLDPADVDELEAGVRRHAVDAPSRRLDLSATVRATADAGGVPALRWRPGRRSLGAWLWLDRGSILPEPAALAGEIARALDGAGLPVTISDFRGLPDPLFGDNGVHSPETCEPEARAARVLVLTDGALLADAVGRGEPRALALLAELATWDSLAVVDFGEDLAPALAPWRIRVVRPEAAVAELAGVALRPGPDTDLSRWAALCALHAGPLRREAALGLRRALGLEVGAWWAAALEEGDPDHEQRAALLSRLGLIPDAPLPDRVRQAIRYWRDHAEDAVEAAVLGLWDRDTLGAALDALETLNAEAVRAAVGALVPADAAVTHPAAIHLPWSIAALPAERRAQLARIGLGWDVGWRAEGEIRPPSRRSAGVGLLAAAALGALIVGLTPWVGGAPSGWVTDGPEPPVPHWLEIRRTGLQAVAIAHTPWLAHVDTRTSGRIRWHEQEIPCEVWPTADHGVRVDRCTSGGALSVARSGQAGQAGWAAHSWATVAIPQEMSLTDAEVTRLIQALLDGGSSDSVATFREGGAARPDELFSAYAKIAIEVADPGALADALQFEGCRPASEVPVWKDQPESDPWTLCGLGARCGNSVREATEACDDGPTGSATCTPTCEKKTACDLGSDLCMVTIPHGSVRIGSPKGGYDDERPTWTVEFTRPFQMLATEVTVAQFERRPAQSVDDRKPKVDVSWTAAEAWCEARGAGWRLPSEAEWEYAARARTTTTWFFGDDQAQLGDYAWFGEDYTPDGAHPVAQKKPSPWGLYDIYGNAWEWTLDGYKDNDAYSSAYAPFAGADVTRDPLAHVDKDGNNLRVIRGGSFNDTADRARSANRDRNDPRDENWFLGFRCVRSPLPQPS